MLRILYVAHWTVPWLILVVGMYALVKFVRGFIDKSVFTDIDQRLFTRYSGLLDLQAMLGLGYFLWSGFVTDDFPVHHVLHGVTMFVAAVIPHFSSHWKASDDSTRFLNNFYLLLASFLIMLVGISFIPNK
jgi:Na+/H+ antiporter NhaC